MINVNNMKKARRLVRLARKILDEAEMLNGQPLYFDEDGGYVDISNLLKHTSEDLWKGIVEESVWENHEL